MKKFFKTIGNYFVNLFRAIFNIKSEPKEDSKYAGTLPDRDNLNKFNLEAIKDLMDKIPAFEQQDLDHVQEQFIANRKAINEYKDWYSKLVGYNKPPDILRKIIEADLKMDRIEMDRLFYQMYQQDLERYKEFRRVPGPTPKSKRPTFESPIFEESYSPLPDEIREIMTRNPVSRLRDRPNDLKRILAEAKEKIKQQTD